MNRVINGNVLSFCRHYRGEPFHALFCDPPYHLTSIVKRFSNGEPEHTKTAHDIANRSTPHARQAAGFMNQKWDGGDIAFRPETWKALSELLYPGAFIFAFAGTRGYHRMAVAMEDAGLVIHPAIGWIFGSGFPKATRIDTQIDSSFGVEVSHGVPISNNRSMSGDNYSRYNKHTATTIEPQSWSGHRYGLQALKPAFEFIAVAQKPYRGKPVDCIVKTGAGALNIDGARIELVDELPFHRPGLKQDIRGGQYASTTKKRIELPNSEYGNTNVRWPANFVLSHSVLCVCGECADDCPIKMMDDQSGEGISRESIVNNKGSIWGSVDQQNRFAGHNDSGGASRFFFNSDYMYERLENSDPIMYQAKAGRTERDAGLIDFPLTNEGSTIGTGIGEKDQADVSPRNIHPTIKAIALCKWLASLLLPPDSYKPRRLLVPFSGAGSEMIGARLAGWDRVIGVEMESEYVTIARARLEWWEQRLADGHTDLDRMLKQWTKQEEQSESEWNQMGLF